MTVVIVIPVFNEAATIGGVVAAARVHGPVLVVDDGSRDGSGDVAAAAGAEVLRHPRRLGKAQALLTGVAAARRRGAALVVTLDGDGQHDPDGIPALLEAARRRHRTVIVGNRFQGVGALPPHRRNAIRVASFFASWTSGLPLCDTQSGFRVYPITLFDEVRTRRGRLRVRDRDPRWRRPARAGRWRRSPWAARPRVGAGSRFRPVRDGVAIGGFLAGRVASRWAREARTCTHELLAVFNGDRLAQRHAALLEAAAPYGDSPAGWGARHRRRRRPQGRPPPARDLVGGARAGDARGGGGHAGGAAEPAPAAAPGAHRRARPGRRDPPGRHGLCDPRASLMTTGRASASERRGRRNVDDGRGVRRRGHRRRAGRLDGRHASWPAGGLSVALFERESFPRFHVGESLMPAAMLLLERLGVLRARRGAAASRSRTARRSSTRRPGSATPSTSAGQAVAAVDLPGAARGVRHDPAGARAEARACTCSSRRPSSTVAFDADGVTLARPRAAASGSRTRARFLVDASGRDGFLASRLGAARADPEPRQGRALRPLPRRRSLLRAGRGQHPHLRVRRTAGSGGSRSRATSRAWAACCTRARCASALAPWRSCYDDDDAAAARGARRSSARAERVTPVHRAANFSYRDAPVVGDRFLSVGDAVAFVDPIFSGGVFIAMRSGGAGRGGDPARLRRRPVRGPALRAATSARCGAAWRRSSGSSTSTTSRRSSTCS